MTYKDSSLRLKVHQQTPHSHIFWNSLIVCTQIQVNALEVNVCIISVLKGNWLKKNDFSCKIFGSNVIQLYRTSETDVVV